MAQLLVTLIGEGPSDDALIPVIEWVLERPALGLLPNVDIVTRFFSPDAADIPGGLMGRIIACASERPGHLFFVHHDADGPTHHAWAESIKQTVVNVRQQGIVLPPALPVVPVREMEAGCSSVRQQSGERRATLVGGPHLDCRRCMRLNRVRIRRLRCGRLCMPRVN